MHVNVVIVYAGTIGAVIRGVGGVGRGRCVRTQAGQIGIAR